MSDLIRIGWINIAAKIWLRVTTRRTVFGDSRRLVGLNGERGVVGVTV